MTASMVSSLPPRSPNCIVRLILCRHGETSLNAKHILQGSGMNPPLNEAGESQAMLLAQRLATTPIDLIISSHLLRAQQTAETIAQFHKDAPQEIISDLAEICWGVFEGKMSPDLSSLRKAWDSGDFNYAPTGGESPSQVCVRVERAFSGILRRAQEVKPDSEATVVVVAHGRFLRIALSWLLHHSLYFMETITHTNCNLNVIDICSPTPSLSSSSLPLSRLSKDRFYQLADSFWEQQFNCLSEYGKPKHLSSCFNKLDQSQAHLYLNHCIGSLWTWHDQEYLVLGRSINDTSHLVLQ